MSLQTFFDNFEQLTETPNGAKKLRELILQLAVRGRLIPQDPTDIPAAIQLQQLKQNRIHLLGQKKIKRVQEIESRVPEESKIGLPSSWEIEWLGNIAQTITKGATPTTYGHAFQTEGIRFVKVENVKNGRIIAESISDFISSDAHKSQARSQLEAGDVLFSIAGTIGETCVVIQANLPANTNQALAIIRGTQIAFWPEFLKLQLDSFVANAVRARARGGAMNNVSLGDLKRLLVYIPPLQEQKRIIAKVDELMRLCVELEVRQQAKRKSQVRLNTAILAPLNKAASLTRQEFKQAPQRLVDSFDTLYDSIDTVDKLRATILQIAVQGKIVPQDPNEEPASELFRRINAKRNALIDQAAMKKSRLLPAIHHNEVPFPVPETWQWVRLNDVFDVRDGTHDTPKYVDAGFPLVTSKNLYTGVLNLSDVKYIAEADHIKISERSRVEKDDVLFAMIGSIGNPVIVQTETEFSIKNVALFKYYSRELSEPMYLHLYLSNVAERMRQQSAGGVQSFVSLGFVRKYLFPLPPLAEQQRIVAKVNQLMSLCDELEAKLRRAEADSEKLMNAAVKHVLDSVRDVSRTGEEVFA